eukprot:jgi/Phyca11/4840/fgenesh1_pm.PHYCAscaffold_3_\
MADSVTIGASAAVRSVRDAEQGIYEYLEEQHPLPSSPERTLALPVRLSGWLWRREGLGIFRRYRRRFCVFNAQQSALFIFSDDDTVNGKALRKEETFKAVSAKACSVWTHCFKYHMKSYSLQREEAEEVEIGPDFVFEDATKTELASKMVTEVSQGQAEEEHPIALAELPSLSSIWEDEELLSHCIDYDAIVKGEKLAAGAYGEVWRAMHRSQEVVVKSLREDVITGSKSPTASSGSDTTAVYHRRRTVLNFVEEIRIMSRLEHNRIVEFRGVALSPERDLLLVMEYLPRGDLRTFLNAVKRKGENATSSSGGSNGNRDQFQSIWTWTKPQWRLAIDIIEGLVYLHSLNPPLVHGDLKSANVLLRSNLRAKLTDFGLSRYLPSSEGEGFGSARSRIEEDVENNNPPQYCSKARGTGRWMAPELLANGAQSSMASDVYAFGIVLSEIDTCELPFAEREKLAARSLLATAGEDSSEDGDSRAMNESTIVHRIVSEGWKPTFRVTCPEVIKKLALECLSPDPNTRPTSLAVAHRIRKAATKRERPEVLAAQAKVTTSLRIR